MAKQRQVGVVTYKNGRRLIKFRDDKQCCSEEQYNSRHGLKDLEYRNNGVAKGICLYMHNGYWFLEVGYKHLCGDRRINIKRRVGKTLDALYAVWLGLLVDLIKKVPFTESELVVLHMNYTKITEAYGVSA